MASSATMTKEQKLWVQAQRLSCCSTKAKKDYPTDPTRSAVYKFVEKEPFEYFIMFVILLNAVMMACEYYEHAGLLDQRARDHGLHLRGDIHRRGGIEAIRHVPLRVLLQSMELLRLLLRGHHPDRLHGWVRRRRFCFRILRIARDLPSCEESDGLRMLFNTLIISLPGLLNIGALMFLLCFVYAILGMNLFGKVKFGENLNEDANFTNFGNSPLAVYGDGRGLELRDVRLHD